MWLPTDIINETDAIARFHYFDVEKCKLWNQHRDTSDLRMLTGWAWFAKDGSGQHRQGFKTLTVAVRDAWYALARQTEAPIPEAVGAARKLGEPLKKAKTKAKLKLPPRKANEHAKGARA